MSRTGWSSWLIAAALAAALPAAAQITAPAAGSFSHLGMTPQAVADEHAVQDALMAFSGGRYDQLHNAAPSLRQVMARAPTSYPQTVTVDGYLVIRDEEADFDRLAKAAIARGIRPNSIVMAFDTYPWAAYLLAQDDNENGRFDEAISLLDRGLSWRPQLAMLWAEKGYALTQTHRNAEAVAAYQRGFAQPGLRDTTRVKLLKGEGNALVGMQRWADAERAYREAQQLAPNDQRVRDQLKLIAEQRPR